MTEDESDALPEGWAVVTLSELVSPSSEKVEPGDRSDAPYLSLEHIEPHTNRIIGQGTGADVTSTKAVFRSGDVLYGKLRPYLNKVTIPDFDGICSTDILVFPSSLHLDAKFLLLLLSRREVVDFANHHSAGVQLPRISFKELGKLEVPFPPLAEQRRIVTAVEGVLAKVSSARERLERVPMTMKRFRQAVLASACSGRLTADWRVNNQNVEHAARLLERLAASRGTTSPGSTQDEDVPSQWVVTTLGFLAEWKSNGRPFITSGSRGWAKYVGSTGRHFIRSENINTEYLRLEDAVRVEPPEGAEAVRTQVQSGDLLLTITGNNVGRTAVVPDGCPVAHVSQHVAIIRVEKCVCVQYLWLWLRAEQHGQKHLEHYGETKPGLNLEQVRDVVVSLPPVPEQEEIVRRVAALFALADSFEQRAASTLKRVESLTQAVLAKAFRGELVPTEAELARREKRTYETADELLARIRAAPAALAKPKRARKATG